MTSTVFGVAEQRLTLNEITGKIPVCINLSNEDIISEERPHSLYFLVPRSTYPMAFAQAIVDEFGKSDFVADFGDEKPPNVWLTWGRDQAPVPWTHPVGVFADANTILGKRLPLTFTARLTHANLPAEVANAGDKNTRHLIYSQLYKQSVMIMFGGEIRPALDLATSQIIALREQGDLLEEGATHKYEDAVRAIFAFRSSIEMTHWPVLIHMIDNSSQLVSKQVKVPISADLTFGRFLREHLPQTRSLAKEDADKTAVKKFDTCSSQETLQEFGIRAWVQGIDPPLSIRMEYLMEQMISCDLRLHVIVGRDVTLDGAGSPLMGSPGPKVNNWM